MDVTATILALTGVKVNTKWPIDGVNLMPFLDAPERGDAPHRILCWEFGPQWAIREDQWKLTYARPGKGAKQPILALYNLSKDISESHDLSTEQPELVKKLQSDWNAWREDVDGGRRTPKSNTNS
jgi:arylsulfatase A-like enzyme